MTTPYTLKKLTDVDDSAAKFGLGRGPGGALLPATISTPRTPASACSTSSPVSGSRRPQARRGRGGLA